MIIFWKMDRLSCCLFPSFVAASFLLFGELELEIFLFVVLLTARVYAGISWCTKNTEP